MSVLTKKMIICICLAALAFIAAGAVYYRSYETLPFALGVALTSALNALKVVMLERAVAKAVDMSDLEAGKNYMRGQYFLRFLFTGLVLAAAAIAPDNIVNIWGAAAGIFTFQIAAIMTKFVKADDGAPA